MEMLLISLHGDGMLQTLQGLTQPLMALILPLVLNGREMDVMLLVALLVELRLVFKELEIKTEIRSLILFVRRLLPML